MAAAEDGVPYVATRPMVTGEMATSLVETHYGVTVTSLHELRGYADRNFRLTVAESYRNDHIDRLWPHGYVLKVLNHAESQKNYHLAEHSFQKWLTEKGFLCCCPVHNKLGEEATRIQLPSDDGDLSWHIICLLTFVPGKPLSEVQMTADLSHRCGHYLGRLHQAMQEFTHEALERDGSLWPLQMVPRLRSIIEEMDSIPHKQLICDIIDCFEREFHSSRDLRKGAIHNDFARGNIIVRAQAGPEAEGYDIMGIIDFGDITSGCLVFDLAITTCDFMIGCLDCVDPVDVGGHVIAGYMRSFSMTEDELSILKVLIAGRLSQLLVLGEYYHMREPENPEHLVTSQAGGWQLLQTFWNTASELLRARWNRIIQDYKLP